MKVRTKQQNNSFYRASAVTEVAETLKRPRSEWKIFLGPLSPLLPTKSSIREEIIKLNPSYRFLKITLNTIGLVSCLLLLHHRQMLRERLNKSSVPTLRRGRIFCLSWYDGHIFSSPTTKNLQNRERRNPHIANLSEC